MMNLENYYIHATGGFWGTKNDQNKIIDILKDGKIKFTGVNKNHNESPDHLICLCDTTKPVLYKNKEDKYLSSFEQFVLYSPSLILSRNFEVMVPKYQEAEDQKEVADCYDEVRCDKEISLEHLKFITFPLFLEDREKALSNRDKLANLNIFKENISIILENFKTIPVKNIYTGKDITIEDIDRQIEIYKKQMK